MHVYITESLCCILETNTALQINYTSIKTPKKKKEICESSFLKCQLNTLTYSVVILQNIKVKEKFSISQIGQKEIASKE